MKSSVAIVGDGTYRRPLNEKHGAAAGKKSGNLASLNAANFHLIGANGKNGRASGLAKLDSVFRLRLRTAQPIPALAAALATCGKEVAPRGSMRMPLAEARVPSGWL